MSARNADPNVEASVARMLEIFDVTPVGDGTFTGVSDGGPRSVVDGSQMLGQAIVAAAKTVDKSIRSANVIFSRAVRATEPIEFAPDIVHNGRTVASVNVEVRQAGRRCALVQVLADAPAPDVIRHHAPGPQVAAPEESIHSEMPMTGRQLRLVDVVDVNSPTEIGPPELFAWLHYDLIPERDDLRKALLAHFTGHLSISTALRPHPGLGTANAHETLSTAVIGIDVAFHEPVDWDGWIVYSHDAAFAGAGAAFVRGQVHTEGGELLASFAQRAMIRDFPRPELADIPTAARL